MEEEAGKVRLVRCPKCENLLPELADFSVYQCGGCGAILRAKAKSLVVGNLSEKSAEENIESGSQKSDDLPGKEVANIVDASEADMKPDTLRQDQSALEKDDFRHADKYKYLNKDTAEKWTFDGDCGMNKHKGLGDMDMRTDLNEVKPLFESVGTSRVPERNPNWRNIERHEVDGVKNLMTDANDTRFLNSNYSNEGPSTYRPGLSYGYAEQARFNSNPEAAHKVEYLEQDRAELLRKLDELKDQLSRSCDIADKRKDNVSLDRKSGSQQSYGNPKDWSLGGSSMPYRDSMQFTTPRERITDPPCLNRYSEPYTYPHRQEMAMPNIFPSIGDSSHSHMYGDPYESHMHRRPMHQVPSQYNEASRPFILGQYMDNDLKPYESYPYGSAFHHPSCSCFHCYSTRKYGPQPIPPAHFNDRRFQDVANDPMFYHRENQPPYTSHTFNPPPLSSRGVTVMKGTSDHNSEEGSILQARPQRVLVGSGRVCYPVAGGAPFITCCNCFELLHLPERVLTIDKNQQSLRCGACSAMITYAVIDKKLVLSVNGEKRQITDEANDSSSEIVRGKKSDFHGQMDHGGASYSFNDYDNTGYEFESLDREPIILSSGHVSNSSKQQDMKSYDSSSPITSDDENSPDVLVPTREEKSSSEQPKKASPSPPPAGSPLQEYIDYSNYNNRVNRFGKGNQSSRSDHENMALNKPTTRQNSVKEAAVATEMDVSYNEFYNSGVSQDSADGSREYNRRRVSKGSDSFLTTFIKKSFSKSIQPADNCKANVSVNGHLISDRLVKKAEKLAGPIRPGQYWYDARAGFWGVMGGPCLGIIPPSIEEFNFVMPEDCAAGDTGVYVNGRELNRKDLDLLVSRGLPTERDRSYSIDISGRVWDEDTGEEKDCLGRLAPTVEKVKHGFGMKVPRTSV